MVNCSFCGGEVQKGTGIMYSKKDGTLFYFCSSKCRHNLLDLGRKGRSEKWTTAYRKYVGQAASVESKEKK